jgi:hypothetical protein
MSTWTTLVITGDPVGQEHWQEHVALLSFATDGVDNAMAAINKISGRIARVHV